MFFQRKIAFDKNDIQSMIIACGKGSRDAQSELVRQHLGYARSICQLYAKNEMEVEEMINDGFLKIFTNIQKYDFSKPFKAWIRAVFINCSIDYYRKFHKSNNLIPLENAAEHEVAPDVVDDLAAEEILHLVQSLPASYRMVFVLYVIEGYNHREIAELLGIQEGTSKSNLRDARIKLKKMILSANGNSYSLVYLKKT